MAEVEPTGPTSAHVGQDFLRDERPAMGTQFRITLYSAGDTSANRATQAAFRRIEELDQRLSDYQEGSELNQLCRGFPSGTAVRVSHDLWHVLRDAQDVAARTEGAFDVTVGPISRIWRRARRQRQIPAEEQLTLARDRTGYQQLSVNATVPLVTLGRANMQLDLGGIAKGFAAEEALKILQRRGFPSAIVDGGGGLALGSPPPGRAGWRIGVPPPLQKLVGGTSLHLSQCSIATSGDTQQFLEWEGARYSHIVDPRSGMALSTRRMALVVAPAGAYADSLATALCVMDRSAIPPLLAQFQDVHAAVTEIDSDWAGYCTSELEGWVATDSDARIGPNGTGTETN